MINGGRSVYFLLNPVNNASSDNPYRLCSALTNISSTSLFNSFSCILTFTNSSSEIEISGYFNFNCLIISFSDNSQLFISSWQYFSNSKNLT